MAGSECSMDKCAINSLVAAGSRAAGKVLQRRLHFLLRRAKKAQRLFSILEEGDRVLVGLSGGKDSLTLVLLLHYWQRFAPHVFDFAALHVEIEGTKERSKRRKLLRNYLNPLGIPLDFSSIDSPGTEDNSGGKRACFHCAWQRRRALFTCAHKNGFNKVALAHHLDDAAETALINLLFHAKLETMEPKVSFFGGAVTLIRPLVLAEEREVVRVSKLIPFPYFECECFQARDSERERAKVILNSFGKRSHMVKRNIWRATRAWLESCGNRVVEKVP